MRLLFPVAIGLVAVASAAPAKSPPLQQPAAKDCQSATSHFARRGSVWTHEPTKPRKLSELPPADAYAAVYRLDERGCMVPVKFREVRR